MKKIIQNIYRLIKYKEYRQAHFRNYKIKPDQNNLIKQIFTNTAEKLIVFLVPGADRLTGAETVSGGVISIFSLCEETKSIYKNNINTAVILCTINGDFLISKYCNFENNTPVFRFEQISKFFNNVTHIIVHVPDYLTTHFYTTLTKKDLTFFKNLNVVHFNILNQNIILMPKPKDIIGLKTIGNLTTITSAHQQYCTQDMSNYYEVPIHKFSVWISPEKYEFKKWEEKENIISFSPDTYINKEKIEIELKNRFPEYSIVTISNLTYSDYKKLILNSKFVITFGEGLDAYFIEPIFSGSISFAVYNEIFFTPEYKNLDNIFNSYEDLETNLLDKISQYDTPASYKSVNSLAYNLCASHYSYNVYKKNIELFYEGKYTYNC